MAIAYSVSALPAAADGFLRGTSSTARPLVGWRGFGHVRSLGLSEAGARRRERGAAAARAAYSGPQPAFKIWHEGYPPLKAYNPAVGRLFIKVSRRELAACSATVVGPSVVVTAAHCLYDSQQHRFYSHFLFVPDLHGSKAPYGGWQGRGQFILKAFARHESVSVDYGFLTLRARHGRRLGGLTGWARILANSPSKTILSFGYPSSGVFSAHCNFSSCSEWACYSPRGQRVRDPNGSYEVGMGCHSGEGSSGGPWFEHYHDHWYLASNVSTGVTFLPDPGYTTNQWGPYYDRRTVRLLAYARARG